MEPQLAELGALGLVAMMAFRHLIARQTKQHRQLLATQHLIQEIILEERNNACLKQLECENFPDVSAIKAESARLRDQLRKVKDQIHAHLD